MQSLAKELASRGHEITFITAFPLNQNLKNYREFKVEFEEDDKKFIDNFTSQLVKNPHEFDYLSNFRKFTGFLYKTGNKTLQADYTRRLMKEENFDLVFVGYFMTEYLVGLADHFKCPSIVFFSTELISSLSRMVGNPLAVAGVSHPMFKTNEMNFFGRLRNFILNGFDLFGLRIYFNYQGKKVYE
jgi:UDP:flavonoid glycosyltransferase YjiC (YdhE family)